MGNFKSTTLGLITGALAFVLSAFNNTQPKNVVVSSRWYQTSEGVYIPYFISGASCIMISAYPCTLDFPCDIPTSIYPSISISDLPVISATYGAPIMSTVHRRYNSL